jgi:hypothetical protein
MSHPSHPPRLDHSAFLKCCLNLQADQIQAQLIQACGETLMSGLYKLIHSAWNKEDLPDQWKEFIIVPIYKKEKKL